MAKTKKKAALSLEERLEQALVPEDEQPYALPENWCWVTFKSIADIKTGKKDANYGTPDGKYAFFTCAAEPIRCDGYSFDCKAMLLAGNGDIRNISLYEGKFEAYQRTYVVETSLSINLQYIYWFFQYRWYDYNRDKMFGTAIPYIRLGNLETFPVPIIPPREQQRIVDRIESLFAKLDEAKEKAQAALDSFETRKAAILHKAFIGELTAKWRKENGVRMESWEKVTVLTCLLSKPRNGYSPAPVNYPTKVKSLTLSATTSGEFKSEHFKYIDEAIEEDSYLWLKTNDILIQRANSIEKVGSSAIYLGADNEFIYPDLMMKLQVNSTMLPKFLAYQLKTDCVRKYLRNNATGTAGNMPKINQGVVSNIPIYRPSTIEQTEIVCILDDFFAKEQRAKKLCSVLDKIDVIKKSILARAFRGELGTNDPKEESAVELLKGII